MIKNTAEDVIKYSFTSGELILLDANIWLYLYPAPSNPSNKLYSLYSTAFSKMLVNRCVPVIDPLILSEYLNRYCRIEYDARYNQQYSSYKSWRLSKDFSTVSIIAKGFALNILKISSVNTLSSNFLNMKQILDNFETGRSDFNDAVYVDICNSTGMKLMTHDSDFQYGGIKILTANNKLLSACP